MNIIKNDNGLIQTKEDYSKSQTIFIEFNEIFKKNIITEKLYNY